MRTSLVLCLCLSLASIVHSAPQTEPVQNEAGAATNVADVNNNSNNNELNQATVNSNNNNEDKPDTKVSEADTTDVKGDEDATGAATSTDKKEGDGDGTSSEDEENVEGMDESLADYMLNLIKNSFKTNTTVNANATVPAANVSANIQPEQAVSDNVQENGEKLTTRVTTPIPVIETETTDFADDFEDSSTQEPFSRNGQANCNVEVDLDNYCIFDELVEEYFDYDLTASGLADTIFDMDIVDRLKAQCARGEWCLGDELPVLMERATGFYRGPFMDEDMWGCLIDVLEKRADCEDRNYMFVVDAADLLYNLFPDGEPDEANEKQCFAHALAALHVTYADFLARNMTQPDEMTTLCDGEGYRMSKTYLCADDACESYFEPREAMEKFSRWQWFMDNVNDIIQNCNLDNECGWLGQAATERTWFGMSTTTTSWPNYESTRVWYGDWDDDQGKHGSYNGQPAESDENMMIALMVATAVGVFFMVLGVLFWRRNRRRNVYHYRENGYGKVRVYKNTSNQQMISYLKL
nr:hypothetical protein BaRGS_015966 [Batillaria attramentaria]